MLDFYDEIDAVLGDESSLSDIKLVVRRCWHYDFESEQVRVWQGQGKLFTTNGNEWLGSIDSNGVDYHKVPALQDGRDGTSVSYNFGLKIPTWLDTPALEIYNKLKSEQSFVAGNTLTSYLALFKMDEGLRPATPIVFFKRLTMFSTKFEESLVQGEGGAIVKDYSISVLCKDENFGRSKAPNGTYSDTIQKERARQLTGDSNFLDRGSEFLVKLANRTYQLP